MKKIISLNVVEIIFGACVMVVKANHLLSTLLALLQKQLQGPGW